MRSFIALQTFEAPETKSVYVEELSYTIRDGNRYLNALAEVWALQGKIKFGHAIPSVQIVGKAIVFDPVIEDVTIWEKTKRAWRQLKWR